MNHSFVTLRKGAKHLGKAMDGPDLMLRLCTIQAINTSTNTVNVTIGAAPSGTAQVTRNNVAYLSSYGPVVGDVCWALANGSDLLILGATGAQSGVQTVVAGDIKWSASGNAQAGWHVCDGSALSRTTYAALFAAIGTTYGAGDGSTTFNIPDARGRSPVGAGQGSGLTNRALGATGGEETNSHVHGSAAHSHTLSGTNAQAQISFGGSLLFMNRVSHNAYTPTHQMNATTAAGSGSQTVGAALDGSTDSATPGNTGTPTDTSNMPPWIAFTCFIKL